MLWLSRHHSSIYICVFVTFYIFDWSLREEQHKPWALQSCSSSDQGSPLPSHVSAWFGTQKRFWPAKGAGCMPALYLSASQSLCRNGKSNLLQVLTSVPSCEGVHISVFPHSEQFLQDFSILFCKIWGFMVAKHLPDMAGGERWLLARLLCMMLWLLLSA